MKDQIVPVLDETIKRIKARRDCDVEIHRLSEYNIIYKYIFYALKAAIHGFPINIHETQKSVAVIQLYKTPVRSVYCRRRHSYLRSNRDTTYMFDMKIKSKYCEERIYNFMLWPQYARVLQKIINSDSVYQLIK